MHGVLEKNKDSIVLERSKDSISNKERPVTAKSNTRLNNNKAVIGGGDGNLKL